MTEASPHEPVADRLDAVAAAGPPDGHLPEPATGRWQPLRLGLLNLYRFDHEEFPFAGGRLLLRGNNGTGKSRVLALTLPFLLDGEVASHRLEPDGDRAKRIEWNLLLGTHEDRLGYTWIEFGRSGGDGEAAARYLTLGCGMRAVRGRGLAQRWFFLTDRRVGVDLHLQAPTGQALTRGRLEEALGDRGETFETATAWRQAVDGALFGLGRHRYEALIDLLIQLRKPQLSRQLDEEELSEALSEALPPLPPGLLGDVAEAFRSLEADRDALASFRAAAQATRRFLDSYSRYAAAAVRRRARQVTSSHSDYESTQRRLRAAEDRHARAAEELERVEADRQAAREEAARATEQVTTLAASPAMDRARELERAREDAAATDRRAGQAAAERDRAEQALTAREGHLTEAEERVAASRQDLEAAAEVAAGAAAAAALAGDHADAVAPLGLAGAPDPAAVEAARADLAAAVDRRERAIAHLRELTGAVAEAASALRTARARLDELAGQLDAARDAEREAARARAVATAEVVEAYRRWMGQAREATPTPGGDPDDVAFELEAWQPASQPRSPLARAVDTAVAAARRRLATASSELAARRDTVEADRADLAGERDRVAAARHLPPPAPPTRDPEARRDRPGAPLWRLVDVQDDVAAEDLAGYEAALEAAGLLDAWVTPDGSLLDPDDHDVALVPGQTPPAPGGGLASVLAPAGDPGSPRSSGQRGGPELGRDSGADRGGGQTTGTPTGDSDPERPPVAPEVVAAVLQRLGARPGAGEAWVAPDGRFRLGPLHGAWAKPQAEHLGQAAREAARRRRLAELEARLEQLDRDLAGLDAEAKALAGREERLEEEVEAAPTDAPIREATAGHAAAVRQVADLRERHGRAEERATSHRQALAAAEADRAAAASDLGLAEHLDDLDGLAAALAGYREALAGLWPTATAHTTTVAARDRAAAEVEQAATARDRWAQEAARLRREAAAAASRRDTLEETVGSQVEEVLARLEDAKARRAAAEDRREHLEERRGQVVGDRRAAETDMARMAETLKVHAATRQAAMDRLAAAVRAGLLPVAAPDLPAGAGLTDAAAADGWAPDPAVRAARAMDKALDGVPADDNAWSRVTSSIHGHFSDLQHALTAHDLRPTATMEDDLFVVTAAFQGRDRGMPALRDLLADEVENRQALLTHREREILEEHLIGDVAAELHRLLHDGEEWVNEVNAELARMPTSAGMQLRFTWQPRGDGPPGLAEARKRLLAHQAGWSPEDRQAVGAFLQERIRRVREADEAGTWQQHLAGALDYRRWHTFSVERRQDGTWRRLTRRTHGTGSGGEKALALTVPQFAAAAAHYRSADERAPRLIMLDEAFVGIDSDMRAKCMGLLAQFDLDVVMTSEREWGCYPTVPALAIAHLATRPGIDAVGVSRWVWNGQERVADGRAPTPAAPPTGHGRARSQGSPAGDGEALADGEGAGVTPDGSRQIVRAEGDSETPDDSPGRGRDGPGGAGT